MQLEIHHKGEHVETSNGQLVNESVKIAKEYTLLLTSL